MASIDIRSFIIPTQIIALEEITRNQVYRQAAVFRWKPKAAYVPIREYKCADPSIAYRHWQIFLFGCFGASGGISIKSWVAVAIAMAALAGCQSSANMKWVKIGYGPELEFANAQCEIASMSVERGVVAWGSLGYVAGAQLGNAIGNEIRKAQFKKQCMILQGWKQEPARHPSMGPAPGASAAAQRQQADVRKAKANDQYFPPAPN